MSIGLPKGIRKVVFGSVGTLIVVKVGARDAKVAVGALPQRDRAGVRSSPPGCELPLAALISMSQ